MFLPRSNDHIFCLLRVDGHEVISSPIEYLVSRKLECRKNIAITCIRHMNTSVIAIMTERERERESNGETERKRGFEKFGEKE